MNHGRSGDKDGPLSDIHTRPEPAGSSHPSEDEPFAQSFASASSHHITKNPMSRAKAPHVVQPSYGSVPLTSTKDHAFRQALSVTPSVNPDRIASIAKTIIKYSRRKLDLGQVKLELREKLPTIPVEQWKVFCQTTYNMDMERKKSSKSNAGTSAGNALLKNANLVVNSGPSCEKERPTSSSRGHSYIAQKRSVTNVKNRSASAIEPQTRSNRIEKYFAPRVPRTSEMVRAEETSTRAAAVSKINRSVSENGKAARRLSQPLRRDSKEPSITTIPIGDWQNELQGQLDRHSDLRLIETSEQATPRSLGTAASIEALRRHQTPQIGANIAIPPVFEIQQPQPRPIKPHERLPTTSNECVFEARSMNEPSSVVSTITQISTPHHDVTLESQRVSRPSKVPQEASSVSSLPQPNPLESTLPQKAHLPLTQEPPTAPILPEQTPYPSILPPLASTALSILPHQVLPPINLPLQLPPHPLTSSLSTSLPPTFHYQAPSASSLRYQAPSASTLRYRAPPLSILSQQANPSWAQQGVPPWTSPQPVPTRATCPPQAPPHGAWSQSALTRWTLPHQEPPSSTFPNQAPPSRVLRPQTLPSSTLPPQVAPQSIVSEQNRPGKTSSILARAVLLAAGKLPGYTLNRRLEPYRGYLAHDIRQTRFDVFDPPVPGFRPAPNSLCYHSCITAVTDTWLHPAALPPNVRFEPSVKIAIDTSHPCGQQLAIPGAQLQSGVVDSTGAAREVAPILEDNVDEIQVAPVPVATNRQHAHSGISKDKECSAASLIRKANKTELPPVISGKEPEELDGALFIKSSSEFVLEIKHEAVPKPCTYNPNEMAEIEFLEDQRDRQLLELDPDNRSDSGSPLLTASTISLGFPVYRCGFYNCGAELHDFSNLVLHCDRVHGRRDDAGNFCCRWGPCHRRKTVFVEIARWQAHVQNEHQLSIRYVCLVRGCKKPFAHQKDLTSHMGTVHSDSIAARRKRKRRDHNEERKPDRNLKKTFPAHHANDVIEISTDGEAEERSSDDIDLLGHSRSPSTATKRPASPFI